MPLSIYLGIFKIDFHIVKKFKVRFFIPTPNTRKKNKHKFSFLVSEKYKAIVRTYKNVILCYCSSHSVVCIPGKPNKKNIEKIPTNKYIKLNNSIKECPNKLTGFVLADQELEWNLMLIQLQLHYQQAVKQVHVLAITRHIKGETKEKS